MAKRIKMASYQKHVEDSDGYCTACKKFTCGGVEPDARDYTCDNCGEKKVMGIEEAMMTGVVEVV